jgi:hypothetical protein
MISEGWLREQRGNKHQGPSDRGRNCTANHRIVWHWLLAATGEEHASS